MEQKKKENKMIKWLLIGICILFLFVMLVLPLVYIISVALGIRKSGNRYLYMESSEADIACYFMGIGGQYVFWIMCCLVSDSF